MRQHKGFVYASALGAVLMATASTTAAFASDDDGFEQAVTMPATTPPPPPSVEGGSHTETKDTLLGTGLFLLAVSYLPAVSVAASSNLQADQHLYAPIAGPWIDLAQRPICAPPINCSAENTNRALLETSGILQGVGAFLTLVGLLTGDDDPPTKAAPAHKPINEAKLLNTKMQVAPAQFGASGYGLAAFGRF
jgi:hypothetical protein